jgi:hypothetical protein
MATRPRHDSAVNSQPRTTTLGTILRMNSSYDMLPIPMRSGLFRYDEQGHGELYPACENCWDLRHSKGIEAGLPDENQVTFMRSVLHFGSVIDTFSPQQPVQQARLETQNAYRFAEASERW